MWDMRRGTVTKRRETKLCYLNFLSKVEFMGKKRQHTF